MPTRARAAASTATEVMEHDEPQQPLPGLQFNETLTWRAGKPIPVAELLRRLQALATEMRDMDQEENEKETFTKVAKELASSNLLGHKDKGIRAWTACCLVDILRLCAPDAPYTGQQLKDIFTALITSILPALSDPSNAYNNQHVYVLQSLAQVKSVVLLTDIPSSETLILHLFNNFFDILSGSSKASTGEQLAKNVEYNMTAILVILVDESTSLPPEVVDIIIAQFLRTDPRTVGAISGKTRKNAALPVIDEKQSVLVIKELPPAYNMAKTICVSCPEKMARYISQYFSDVIMDASAPSNKSGARKEVSHRRHSEGFDDVDKDSHAGPTEEDLKELNKAHRLLRELWRASPGVLQNVIPQLEAELSAENVQLRLLATETFGDIISGIGAAGPPPPPILDTAAYPPITLSSSSDLTPSANLLTTPSSPQPFPQLHPHAYLSFLGRRQDKSALIRSAWTTGIGRILATSAGGVGLSQHDEQHLIEDLARMLGDSDEKVRLAAVRAIGSFEFKDIILRLGSSGSVSKPGSVLANLAERVKDRKPGVRGEAMRLLARIWGMSVGEIIAGDEQVISTIGGAPSKILNSYYANDVEVNLLMDHVVFELLLPLSYPPIKVKSSRLAVGNSQRVHDSQANGTNEAKSPDPDKIRIERMLVLAKYLDEKAKKVLFMIQSRQVSLAKYVSAYLQCCEDYNGGVMDEDETPIKEKLTKLIVGMAQLFPDSTKVTADLWKFAEMHDRRSYQLIRFCMAPESDYRTVCKALKEFKKRVETSSSAPAGLLDTLTPLLYRTSIILYNKSHVPAIMEYSTTDENSLGSTAHEVLREISTHTPEVLKAHIKEICRLIQEEAPTVVKPNSSGAVDGLKACASFARRFPKELPKDRKFEQAMLRFTMHGTPPEAAKYAVSIIMASSEKKEMLARDLARKCIEGFTYGQVGFLSRLASLSQLWLLAPQEVDENSDAVIDIAIKQILLQVRAPSPEPSDEYTWSDNVDSECSAKCWALKILVNRLRSHPTASTLAEIAVPVHRILSKLVTEEGELLDTKNTPGKHRSRLRLLAARSYLKISLKRSHESLLSPTEFNHLAQIAQDPLFPVRASFLQRLRKYLGLVKLTPRFYTIPFLLAFEPDAKLRADTSTWIRSRVTHFSNLQSQQTTSSVPGAGTVKSKASTVLELAFARLLSLLAHHPDYSPSSEDLADFARYIIFYLQNVANEGNLSLIYHFAQRVKGYRDAISTSTSKLDSKDKVTRLDDNLYHLSDLAQLTIRRYEEAHGWTMQTLLTNAKLSLPHTLFREIKDHTEAIKIAEKNFLPEGVEEEINELVRSATRKEKAGSIGGAGRKRRSEGGDTDVGRNKKIKNEKGLPIRNPTLIATRAAKPPKRPREKKPAGDEWERESRRGSEVPDSERRRSGRVKEVGQKIYVEREDDEDDEEMEELNQEDEDEGIEGKKQGKADEDGGEGEGEGVQDEDDRIENGVGNEGDEEVEKSPIAKSKSRKKGTDDKQNRATTSKAKKQSKTRNLNSNALTGRATRSKGKSKAADPKDDGNDKDADLSEPPDSD